MKIKPTDLRIGNLVNTNYHIKNTRVTEIREIVVCLESVSAISYTSLSPIPLTEEWLLNFDFYKGIKFYTNGIICLEHSNEGGFKFSIFPEDDENQVVQYASTPMDAQIIYYVHQLQNLYWAITGEEITLNPDL